jgi:hypothetical protein
MTEVEFTGDYETDCELNQSLGESVTKSTLGIGRRIQILTEAMQDFDKIHPKSNQILPR